MAWSTRKWQARVLFIILAMVSYVGVSWMAAPASADHQAGEHIGEIDDRHCYFSGTRQYRFWPDYAGESVMSSVLRARVNAAASSWSSSSSSAVDFVSLGQVPAGGDFRVYQFNNAHSTSIGYWQPQDCSLGQQWAGTSTSQAMAMNENLLAEPWRLRQAVAVHELGHAVGLSHFQNWDPDFNCGTPPVGPTSAMGNAGQLATCFSSTGPTATDTGAAGRIKNPGLFKYRNGLTSGTVIQAGYRTEPDDDVFVGYFGSPLLDRIASFDNDQYQQNNTVNNILLYRTGGGVASLPGSVKFNLETSSTMHARGTAVAGNTHGNFFDEILIFDESQGRWIIRSVAGTLQKNWFYYGNPNDIPVVGDWNCSGKQTIGVFRPSTGQWFLSNGLGGPVAYSFYFGNPGDKPVTGDWHSGCGDEIGVVRGTTWYLNHTLSGTTHQTFSFGVFGMTPMLGDFDGDGDETPAFYK